MYLYALEDLLVITLIIGSFCCCVFWAVVYLHVICFEQVSKCNFQSISLSLSLVVLCFGVSYCLCDDWNVWTYFISLYCLSLIVAVLYLLAKKIVIFISYYQACDFCWHNGLCCFYS